MSALERLSPGAKPEERAEITSASAILTATFDRQTAVPLYRQLKFHIIHAISTGRLPTGTVLPSVRVVSREMGLASATVQRAYAELQRDGYVVSEASRGMYVGTLDGHPGPDQASRDQVLDGLLLMPITQAQAMGFSDQEILEAAKRVALRRKPGGQSPRIVFVGRPGLLGRTGNTVSKYTQILRAALAASHAEVVGLEFDVLERTNGTVFDEIGPVHLAVSLVSNFGQVRQIAMSRGVETYGLMVELSDETKRSLIALPDDAHVALVGESVFLSNTRALVDQIRGHHAEMVWATENDAHVLSERLADSNVVLHTLGTSELAQRHAPPTARLLELTFLPMQASLAHLSEIVAALARQSRGDDVGRRP